MSVFFVLHHSAFVVNEGAVAAVSVILVVFAIVVFILSVVHGLARVVLPLGVYVVHVVLGVVIEIRGVCAWVLL